MTDTTTTQAPEPITRERLEELLSEAIRQRGASYVYREPPRKSERDTRCLYVHDRGTPAQQPGCIIGLVYQLHTGQPVPEGYEGKSAEDLGVGVWADEEVADAAARVQMDQDAGMTWGEAVALGLDPDLAEEDEDGDHYEDSDAYEGAV